MTEAANQLHSMVIHTLRTAAVDDRRLGLTPERLSLLSVVLFAGPLAISRIADIEGISAAAVSRSISALQRLGLVSKTRPEFDSRVVEVVATAKGRRLLDRGRRQRLANLMPLLSSLTSEELATVTRACELLDGREPAIGGRSGAQDFSSAAASTSGTMSNQPMSNPSRSTEEMPSWRNSVPAQQTSRSRVTRRQRGSGG